MDTTMLNLIPEEYREMFKTKWSDFHSALVNQDNQYDFLAPENMQVKTLLCLLALPTLLAQQDLSSPRLEYQEYLPRSVWEDLPRAPGTRFGIFVLHFEFIMGFYLSENDSVSLVTSWWPRMLYYFEAATRIENVDQTWGVILQAFAGAMHTDEQAYFNTFEGVVPSYKQTYESGALPIVLLVQLGGYGLREKHPIHHQHHHQREDSNQEWEPTRRIHSLYLPGEIEPSNSTINSGMEMHDLMSVLAEASIPEPDFGNLLPGSLAELSESTPAPSRL